MKKSVKRCLILAIVIAIAVVTMACVSAVNGELIKCYSKTCNGQLVTTSYGDVVAPQCEERGFTWLICDVCGAEVGKTNWKDSLGHQYATKDYTLDETKAYYQKNLCCSREDCNYGLEEGKLKPEIDKNKNEVKYCKVRFIHDFVTDEYEDQGQYYAVLAKTYKQEVTTKYVEYPESGVVAVSVDETPIRIADLTFGGYKFAGWLTEDKIVETINPKPQKFSSAVYDTGKIMSDYTINANGVITYNKEELHKDLVSQAKDYKVEVGADTPADYTLHAIFEVLTNVRHKVTFVNYDGRILHIEENADHGFRDVAYTQALPLRPDNIEYKYTFDYWSLPNSATVVSNKPDSIPPVYGDLTVMAHFHKVAREYNFKYFYYDKNDNMIPFKPELKVDDTVVITGTAPNGKDIDVPTYFDAKYIYEHIDNMWRIPGRSGHIVDLNHVLLPNGTLDNTQLDYIALVPYYQPILRDYKLPVSISYEDDGGDYYHPENLKIEVRDDSGKGIAYTEVVYDRLSQDNNIAFKTTFDVNYSSRYYVTVTAESYSGTNDNGFFEYNENDPDDDHPGSIHVILKRNADSPCNCICHTFFKPVWVGILNLLNSVFKAEFVCCDDMFANIGPQLNYGPAKK